MTAATHNLIVNQGSDFAMELKLSENGDVRNLTGYFARSQIRAKKTDSSISAEFTCNVHTPLEGRLSMGLPNSVTKTLSPGIYHYDLELYTNEDAIVVRLLEGTVTVTAEVTR
jgi:hypothetical protein